MRGVRNLDEKIDVFDKLLELRDKFRSAEGDQRSAIAWQIARTLHRESVDSYEGGRRREPSASVHMIGGTLDSGHNLLRLCSEFQDDYGNYLVEYMEPFFSNEEEKEYETTSLSYWRDLRISRGVFRTPDFLIDPLSDDVLPENIRSKIVCS